jgi:hypothetical protein
MLREAASARSILSVFKAKYQGLVIRHRHKKAPVALAHQLIPAFYFMLSRREGYHDSPFKCAAVDVAKNPPGLNALKRYGYWPKATPG